MDNIVLCITDKCRMGCTHCFGEYEPDGEHMSMDTLEASIQFINRIESFIISVTGGEPTEHPLFLEIMQRMIREYGRERLLILSNGMFFDNNEYAKDIIDLRVKIQITNDKRYYPGKINGLQRKWVFYEDNIRTLYPQGKARYDEPIGRRVLSCFNFRSIGCNSSEHNQSIKEIVNIMEQHGKFCSPFVGINGEVYLGESRLCTPIGYIGDSDKALLTNLRNLRCRNCGMPERMPIELMRLIEQDT